jgi:brefeldin A-inhibited guanine nucleotide-exchange protein
MIIFQLSCSILLSLVSRFRAGLKAEIGVFFPMIVLRVLENVAQPDFQQKMIVLRFLDKLCVDSQILVDIFINYDCDVNSSNIFERYDLISCCGLSLRPESIYFVVSELRSLTSANYLK